jgi:GT2 family glycosyltransferase
LFNSGLPRLSRRLSDRLCLEGAWNPDRAREIPWPIGALLLVRRRAFDLAGGFAEDQWMFAEDIDLAWRVRRAGYIARYEPTALARHVAGASTRPAFGDDLAAIWMAATYAWIARRHGVLRAWTIAAINVAGVAGRLLALAPLVRLSPARYGARYDELRRWLGAHRRGLRSRRVLRTHHIAQRSASASAS